MEPDQFEQKPTIKSHIIELIEAIAIFAAIYIGVQWLIAQPHKVDGSSMFPTFHSGDYIITNKIGYRFSPPERGDVIVLISPQDNTKDFIKRVIGLPNEKVKIQDGHVYINGKILNEPYIDPSERTYQEAFLREGEDVTIPPGDYVVIGDNRSPGGSSDSREWGFVPKEKIIGRVFLRYWPITSLSITKRPSYPN